MSCTRTPFDPFSMRTISFGVVPDAMIAWNPDTAAHAIVMKQTFAGQQTLCRLGRLLN